MSKENSYAGSIIGICDEQSGIAKATGNAWRKRDFVIETDGEYPKKICFTIFGDEKVEKFNEFNSVGKKVEVFFNAESKGHEGRWYTSLNAWMVKSASSNQSSPSNEPAPSREKEDDVLPF